MENLVDQQSPVIEQKPCGFDAIRVPLAMWYLGLDESTREKLAPLAALLLSNSNFPDFQRTKLDFSSTLDLTEAPSASEL